MVCIECMKITLILTFNIYIYIYIYIYLSITQHPLPLLWGWHTSCQETSYRKRETNLKKEKKRNKFSPLYPFSCRLSHRQISTLRLHIAMTTHNCASRHGLEFIYPLGYAPCIPPRKPSPFSSLAWHPNLFCLNIPSRYQSISSTGYSLNDYQHTLLHRLLAILSFSILSTWPNNWRIPSSILLSNPFATLSKGIRNMVGLGWVACGKAEFYPLVINFAKMPLS